MTSLLSQISLVAAMAAVNNMIRKYGALDPIFGQEQYAQIPMAVVGIVMKFFQIVISIAVGLAAGCIPVTGYNVGAGRKDRARELFILLLKAEAMVGFIALLIVELMPEKLIGIFGAANESVYYTERVCSTPTALLKNAIDKSSLLDAGELPREMVMGSVTDPGKQKCPRPACAPAGKGHKKTRS